MKTKGFSVSVLILVVCAFFSAVSGQDNGHLITSNAAGRIRMGMTVFHARKVMSGYRFKRVFDGEGVALIEILRKGETVMTLYAGEEDRDAKINERGKIEQIWVWDPAYRTVNGLHVGMTISSAEHILGKVKKVFVSEIESREWVVFTKRPKGLFVRIRSGSGIFPPGQRVGTKYARGTKILMIQISPYIDSGDF
jgi:hypothetical protein